MLESFDFPTILIEGVRGPKEWVGDPSQRMSWQHGCVYVSLYWTFCLEL